MRILPLIIATAALLYSCDKKESSINETQETTLTNDSTNVADTLAQNATVENAGVGTQSASTAVATNNSGDRPALNPEHGQPHHRCDIQVGAPIDSAPMENPAPAVMPQQNVSNKGFNTNPISPSVGPVTSPSQATGPKPANNPAHGEPHHRCDLQVGAPLT